MGKIIELSSTLISQIAAGEVLERPASAVKELVENAIDANSTEIEVEIDGGGIDRIAIRDNGDGMTKDDLPLALKRHATSKISDFASLLKASTYGFRGEALASMASVANIKILSKTAAEDHAWEILSGNGESGEATPASRQQGTSIEVADLFFFVPARRKFLKSATTEFNHCLTVFERAAVSQPSIAMTIKRDGRNIKKFLATPMDKRFKNVFGFSDSERSAMVDFSYSGYEIKGVLVFSRASGGRDAQLLFVNGRCVRDKTIGHAMKESLTGFNENHKDTSYAIFITTNPENVDSNAHPAKTEVRFREPGIIHQGVSQAIKNTLQNAGWSSEADGLNVHPRYDRFSIESKNRALVNDANTSDAGSNIFEVESSNIFDHRTENLRHCKKTSAIMPFNNGRTAFFIAENNGVAFDVREAMAMQRAWALMNDVKSGKHIGSNLLLPFTFTVPPSVCLRVAQFKLQLESFGMTFSSKQNDETSSLMEISKLPIGFEQINPVELVSIIAENIQIGTTDLSSFAMAFSKALNKQAIKLEATINELDDALNNQEFMEFILNSKKQILKQIVIAPSTDG